MAVFAVRPDGLPATRVPRNNLPPLCFQPYAPLAPHHELSLRFRKTTRQTDALRRLFAGRTLMTRLRRRKCIARLSDELAGPSADSRSPVNLDIPARRRRNHLTSQKTGRIVGN